ncbi:hypothetical protein J4N02_01895 [Propioniciclava sp. MC1595]|uniref:hypothetical protein n=1 Tax=Propioniciclava sp. MC1595 TaxID=2760308 RepID=UPI0016623C79|nr:hypothetical protein [Propioniciclava sp. MC1595]MBB1496125.1 hypothetical protein [Propioniciclava sp. MC1595]QTE26405.1 hypothetical protein J4N02_01895 [Propioniciclava sp. MC1595]
MGVHAQSATATVDPSIVWERWTEPEYWPQDDPSILRAKRNGPLAKGAVGVLRWKKGGRSTYRIVEVDRSALRFVTETKLPLATATYARELTRPEVEGSDAEGAVDVDPDARVLTHRLTIKGPLAKVWDRFVGRPMAAELPGVLDSIIAAASVTH